MISFATKLANAMSSLARSLTSNVVGVLGGIKAGLFGAVSRAKALWRDLRSDPEGHANQSLLVGSLALTATALAAFLWLAGLLDWRGSDGDIAITFVFECQKPGETKIDAESCWQALGENKLIQAFLALAPRGNGATLDVNMGIKANDENTLSPWLTKSTGLQIISTREFDLAQNKAASVTQIDRGWYSTLLQPPFPVAMEFGRSSLMRYIGLSEREVSIHFSFVRGGAVFYGRKTMSLMLNTPVNFEVVDASPPGSSPISQNGRQVFQEIDQLAPYIRERRNQRTQLKIFVQRRRKIAKPHKQLSLAQESQR